MKSVEYGGKPKIDIMHVIERLRLGGAENLLLVLARKIDRSRFTLSFCCFAGKDYVAERLKEEGFKVVCVDKYRMRYFHKTMASLIRLKKSECVDIVQTHLAKGNMWGRICAHLAGISLVCRAEHSHDKSWNKQWTLRNSCRLIAERILDRFSARIIYVSDTQRKSLNKGKYNPDKQVVIHNAVDQKRFIISGSRERIRSFRTRSLQE